MIVATAGHVDHGKTLLVKALTGMDTDRPDEEKRRGLSINLGFAYRHMSKDRTIAFVDVPGHTRFINNMIAGISGIDIGMLVIAADDGPMPQTREHFDVLKLLGVKHFVPVLSKVDRVDSVRLDEVKKMIQELFEGIHLPGIFEVNTPEGKGIEELASFLETESDRYTVRSRRGYFRLSIDRAFNIKGSGLVVTGTIISGRVSSGDSLQLLPHEKSVRIRSLQTQEKQVDQAFAGQRCALDITGDINRADIERGDWLLDPQFKVLTTRFDAELDVLPRLPFSIKHMTPVKLYVGARRVPARLALLEKKVLHAGDHTLAQLLPLTPLHLCQGDRFLIRDDSESETLGGGIILDPHAPKNKRSTATRLTILRQSAVQNSADTLRFLLFDMKQIVDLSQYCIDRNIRIDEVESTLNLDEISERLNHYESPETYLLISAALEEELRQWLLTLVRKDTSGKGLERYQIQSALDKEFPGIDLALLLTHSGIKDNFSISNEIVSLKQEETDLTESDARLWQLLEKMLRDNALNVPATSDIGNTLKLSDNEISNILKIAGRKRWLYMVGPRRPVLANLLSTFADQTLLLSDQKKLFSVADFRKACGIGRNLAVEILEYFDKIGFTLRKEDGRVILDKERVNKLVSRAV